MSFVFDVTLTDGIDVVDSVTREPNRIDIIIEDVLTIVDLVILPRSVAITSVSPGLVRSGDSVVIKGQGFATSIANNRVTFNGFAATITAAAEDELTVTAPALIAFTENGVAQIEVESPPFSALKGRSFAWVKWSTAAEEADEELPLQLADVNEDVATDRPRFAEAEDMNKLITLVDHSQMGGAEGLAGGFKSRDAVGLVGVTQRNVPDTTSQGGESLVIDPSQAGLVALGWQMDDVLAFGGIFQAFNSGAAFLRANGSADGVLNLVENEQIVMLDGVIDLAWLLVKESGTDFLDAVSIFVNGISVFTDGTNFTNDQVATYRPSLTVSKGDRVEFQANKFGTNALMRLVGGIRVRCR